MVLNDVVVLTDSHGNANQASALHGSSANADTVRPASPIEFHRVHPRRLLEWTILLIAGIYSLAIASSFFIPLMVSFLLALSMIPLVRVGERWGIRPEIGALLVLFTLTATAFVGISSLAEPVRAWVTTLPASTAALEERARRLMKPVDEMSKTAAKIDSVTTGVRTNDPRIVTLKVPTLLERMVLVGRDIIVTIGLILLFLYFFLAYGERLITNSRSAFPISSSGMDARDVMNEIGQSMSQYLLLVGLINCGLGLAQWGAMSLAGMPNPELWGVMAAVLNFIPYIGGLLGLGVIAAVSLMTFDGATAVLIPPLVYAALDGVEGAVVTPMLVGHRFSINPAVGTVWLVFWAWIWGPIGGLIAMPMLMAFKILCDHIPSLAPVGILIELDRRRRNSTSSSIILQGS